MAVAATSTGEAAAPPVSLVDALRTLPLAIQGIWVGIVCIFLLIGSAAALRTLFTGNVGAAPARTATAATVSPSAAPTTLASNAAPTAAPTAEPTATTLAIGGPGQAPGGAFGALAIRDRLATHVRLRKIGPFIDDLNRLVDIEPAAIDRADVRKMITDVAVQALAPSPGGAVSPEAERMFTFLTTRAGAAGPDILFDLVTTRGGTRAAKHAEELLARPDVVAKGTAAFKIANELRVAATCQDRTKLFERAKTEGDRRVLQFLFQMARCGKGPTDCCLGNDPAYREVVRAITARK